MTDTKEDIRKALAAATPGNWDVRGGVIVDSTGAVVANPPRMGERMARGQIADAHLIANAPQWLAGLLAECDGLRARVAMLDSLLAPLQAAAQHAVADLDFALVGMRLADALPLMRKAHDEALTRAELAETKHASCEAHLRLVTEERERFAEQREDWRARSIANEERAEQAEKERDALKRKRDAVVALFRDAARKRDAMISRAEKAERDRDALRRHFDTASPEHNLPALLDLYFERAEAAEKERDSLLVENARLQGEIAQHIAFRAEVNDALPRPFGVTVIGAIKALRDELDARPAITEDDIDAIREGIYGDDRMSRKTLEAALAALSRVAHASQPKGDGGSDA